VSNRSVIAFAVLVLASHANPIALSAQRPPIIDMHLHAASATMGGGPPIPTCAEQMVYLPRDPLRPYPPSEWAACDRTLQSSMTDDELMRRTLAIMEQYNVIGVTSGYSMPLVRRWHAAAKDRIIPAIAEGPRTLDSLRAWATNGSVRVLGELGFQYAGLAPTDSLPVAYFALAEELDLPVGIHVGLGAPGTPYSISPQYRMTLSNPLLLEEVLVAHPRLRLYVMHAGWPMLDAMIGLLYAHPQVYVDVGVISWFLPRAEFHSYLKRLIDAGMAKRIMFGSDQMIWPDAIPIAIEGIESATFLTPSQKRDIFYNNAARFLRLNEAEIAKHHGR
jgi:predicted TIM-barrel fold metal-dependent hydrolase